MSPFSFLKRRRTPLPSNHKSERGFLVFENTSEVIRAKSLLKERGRSIRAMGPPPEIRRGCDLVIEFPLIEMLKIQTMLDDAGIAPIQAVYAARRFSITFMK